jgi:hypothetical protein
VSKKYRGGEVLAFFTLVPPFPESKVQFLWNSQVDAAPDVFGSSLQKRVSPFVAVAEAVQVVVVEQEANAFPQLT